MNVGDYIGIVGVAAFAAFILYQVAHAPPRERHPFARLDVTTGEIYRVASAEIETKEYGERVKAHQKQIVEWIGETK